MEHKKIAAVVFRNSAYNITAQIVNNLFYFIIVIIIARSLSESDFGKYSTAKAFTALFVTFCSFGMDFLIIRDISRDQSKAASYLTNSLLLKLAMSFVVLIAVIISERLMNYPMDTAIAIYIFTFANILAALYTTYEAMFKAYQKMLFSSLSVIVGGFMLLCMVCLFALNHAGLIAYSLASLVVGVLTAVLLAFMIKRFLSLNMGEFSLSLCKYLFLESIPFGIARFFVIIFLQVGTVMLSKMASASVVGNYNVAYKVIFALMFFHTAYMIAIYPVLSKSFKESKENLKISFEKTVKYFIIYGLFLAIFITFRAADIIHILYGNKYHLSILTLRCLIWSYPFVLLSTITADTLNSINMTRVNAIFAALAAVLNFFLNYYLIPKYSLIGTAMATLITMVFVFVGPYMVLSKRFVSVNFLKISYKTIIACVALILILFATMNCNIIIAVILGTLVYCSVLILLKSFSKGEFDILRSFFRKDSERGI